MRIDVNVAPFVVSVRRGQNPMMREKALIIGDRDRRMFQVDKFHDRSVIRYRISSFLLFFFFFQETLRKLWYNRRRSDQFNFFSSFYFVFLSSTLSIVTFTHMFFSFATKSLINYPKYSYSMFAVCMFNII